MYPRFIEDKVRVALTDTAAVALTGPRQSGKTTLAKKFVSARRPYLTLDDATALAAARRDPVGFMRGIDEAVIDEVQRAPDLVLAIKRAVDEDPGRRGRFLLTGSADLLTIPRIEDMLPGRLETFTLFPLSRSEIAGRSPKFLDFAFQGRVAPAAEKLAGEDLVAAVLAGGYPEVVSRKSEARRQDWCRAYVNAIVKRDVRDIAGVTKLEEMARLVRVLAELSGQLLNLSAIGGQLGIDHKTADRYVRLLEQLFIVRRLSFWHGNHLKRLIKTPKLHFLDSGLLASLQRQTAARLKGNRGPFGALLEGFVHGELAKQAAWADRGVSIFHYRDKDQEEVDFVLESDEGLVVGVEVKAAATVSTSDFNGMRRLAAPCGCRFKCGVVVYDGVDLVPFGDNMFAAPVSSLWR